MAAMGEAGTGEVHYPLLALTRGRLSGPLAELAGPQVQGSSLGRALRAVSRVTPGSINVLGMRAKLGSASELTFTPTGLLARSLGRTLASNLTRALLRKGLPRVRRGNQLIYTLYQPPIPSAPMLKVLASRLHLERTGRPLPATHTMQITSACQCDCLHCSAARHRRPGEAELTTEEAKALIRQSQALGVVNIVFTGGEPLLRQDICELITAVDQDEAIATMFSNGLMLSADRIARLQEAGLFSLMVSLDHPDPAQHDRMRRSPGCWQRAVAGINRCLEAGLLCGISTYATPQRLRGGEVMAMVELGRRLGVPEITIFDVVPTGRLLREEERALLTEADKQELCALEEEINARAGYPHVITQAHVNGPTGAGCYAAWFQFYSTAYGDVMPCDFTPLSFGNIRKQSLAEIWETMTSHAAYCARSSHCRMQDRAFRRQWIDRIPTRGPFPFPIEQFAHLPETEELEAESVRPQRAAFGIRA